MAHGHQHGAQQQGPFPLPGVSNIIAVGSGKGGVERTAQQFSVPFLGSIELDPEIRKGGDAGNPPALAGENDPHSKSLYDFAKQVLMRLAEVKSSSAPGDVIQVQ